MGIKSYNRLPLELRESKGFNDFKHKLKLFLLDHPFYTIQEIFLEGQWLAWKQPIFGIRTKL
jgi:hypothetical protein